MPYRSHISIAHRLWCILVALICVAFLAMAAIELGGAIMHGAIAVELRGSSFIVEAANRPIVFAGFALLWLAVAIGAVFGVYGMVRMMLRR